MDIDFATLTGAIVVALGEVYAGLFGSDAEWTEAVRAAGRHSLETLTPWVQEFQVRRSDGLLRWIRGCSTPQLLADGRVLWHGYFEDVTEWLALARADHRQRHPAFALVVGHDLAAQVAEGLGPAPCVHAERIGDVQHPHHTSPSRR